MAKCRICGYEYNTKAEARNHFLEKHKDIVQKWIDNVYEPDRQKIKNIINWAAGEAAFANSDGEME